MTEVNPPSMQGFANLEIGAVVQMENDGQIGLHQGCLHQLGQIGMAGIFSCAGRNLQD